jgi:amino acid adenylation domain-containing protein
MSLDDRLSSLTPAQRELFEVLRKKQESARPARREPPPLVRRPQSPQQPEDAAWPLALDQERLWFLHQLDPADVSFNIGEVTRLEGSLDPAVLAGCLTEVVRRHEAWRTTFPERDGQPAQVVSPAAPGWTVPLPLADLSGLPAERREAEARRVSLAELRRPFDLARGPVIRAWLIRREPRLHECGLVAHHIVTDGYSSQIFWGELAVLYPALAARRPSPLPELPVQYADFAVWQRALLDGAALQEHLDYWTRHLAGAPLVLELPTDRPRPTHGTTRGRRVPLALSRARSAGIKALAQRRQATPFMVILALYQILLSRQAAQERVIVGSPNLNRNRPELHRLLGFFLTQLVFCTDLGGDPTFPELLERVRQVALGAFAHQDLPFARLVEALRPERDTSRPPVAQVTLLLQEAPPAGAPAGPSRLRMAPVELDPEASASELTLALWDGPEGHFGYLEHNADLFDATTAARFGEGLLNLIDALLGHLGDPEAPLSALPAQSEAATHQVLREWNDTGAAGSLEPVHRRIAAQAARTPDALALLAGTERWTYRELAGRAAELARRLRDLGVGPEDRVAIRLPRSAELVAALLGALEAGAAYVPLDPAWPEERIRFMLEDCGAKVILDSGFSILDSPRPPGNHTRSIEPPIQNPKSKIRNLAYLIYTSGSTGRPKAVGITHHNLAAFIDWSAALFPELSGKVLFSTSVCFDLSVFEIFGTLACGGTLIVAENVLALPELPGAGEVELINTVPSAMAELLRLGPLPPAVRTITLCGEPFSRRLADEIHARGIARPVNLYGPTEDTVFSTWAPVPRGEILEPAIGRSLTGSRAYILDRGDHPVPLGARGELYLAGEGLARGYLGRPELTAERFVPDPVGESPGGRLYRTGDLARWRANGFLEFLGRADRQVKVRGFRVEPAEIEAALSEVPGVAEVAVGLRDERLAAWLVPAADTDGKALLEAARSALLDRLPRHMVPALWAHLPALPRTPNGKVDLRALPMPDASGAAAGEDEYVPPRNRVEERLAEIWAEILRLPRVGVQDNFFRLGGDSILSIRVVSRAREAGLGLSLYQMFERQTVAELAAAAVILDPSLQPSGPQNDLEELMVELEGMSEGDLKALLAEIPQDEE